MNSFKRRKQNSDYVLMLSKTLQKESIEEFKQENKEKQITEIEKHTNLPFVYTIKQFKTSSKELINYYEPESLDKNKKSLECINSNIDSFPMKDYVYDIYVPLIYTPDTFSITSQFGILEVDENEDISFLEETSNSSQEDDSNAEDFYRNTYPDEDAWPDSDTENYPYC
ncbi:hypothetical protein PORY_002454 [Pneumocystis oryctolagi]|uniref:Uncharacterized protein n=1 Tax=Pneumocystis oryctolagi TaxID=42067 RepID=A0ACB7CAN6_9ASCO|nr:hypothetical protein PORY_002454 [Pneumocystis oryctolagi]